MSMINQMLKDIERRRSAELTANDKILSGLAPGLQKPAQKKQFKFWLIIAGAFIFMNLLTLSTIHKSSKPSSHAATQNSQRVLQSSKTSLNQNPITAYSLNSNASLMPASIDNYYLVGDKIQTQLHISLNKQAIYSIDSNNDQSLLILTLYNTHAVKTPWFETGKNSVVNNLRLQANTDGNTQFIISLLPGTTVTNLAYADYGATQLILTLANQNTQSSAPVSGTPLAVTDENTASADTPSAASAEETAENDAMVTTANTTTDSENEPGSEQQNTISATNAQATTSTVVKVPTLLPPLQQADTDYQNALTLVNQGNIANAIIALRKILSTVPAYDPARAALVTLLLQQNNIDDAKNILSQGLLQEPNYVPFIMLQARIAMAQNQLHDAMSKLQAQNPSMTQYPGFYALQAALYQKLHQPLQSAELYYQLLKLKPDNGVWWLGLGISLEQAKKPKAALEAYRKASSSGNISVELQDYVDTRIQALGRHT